MKKLALWFVLLACVCTGSANAQSGQFSVGIVTSQFINTAQDDGYLSTIKNPAGFGVILGYQFHEKAGVGFTGEYMHGDMNNVLGEEKNFRSTVSFFVFPVKLQHTRFYISWGLAFNNRRWEYEDKSDETDMQPNFRGGIGLDYSLTPNVAVNLDVGMYGDGMNYLGSGSTIGIRYTL